MAGIPGLEPRLTESESAVLPLDDIPTTAFHHNLFFIKLQDVFLLLCHIFTQNSL